MRRHDVQQHRQEDGPTNSWVPLQLSNGAALVAFRPLTEGVIESQYIMSSLASSKKYHNICVRAITETYEGKGKPVELKSEPSESVEVMETATGTEIQVLQDEWLASVQVGARFLDSSLFMGYAQRFYRDVYIKQLEDELALLGSAPPPVPAGVDFARSSKSRQRLRSRNKRRNKGEIVLILTQEQKEEKAREEEEKAIREFEEVTAEEMENMSLKERKIYERRRGAWQQMQLETEKKRMRKIRREMRKKGEKGFEGFRGEVQAGV